MAMGVINVPPVSSPSNAVHCKDKEFLVAETNVIKPGRVGSTPANVEIYDVQTDSPTRL